METTSIYIHPTVSHLMNVFQLNFPAFVLTFLTIWGVVIYVVMKAKRVRKDTRSIVVSHEAPKEVSALLARFLMVAGREGGRAGEISKEGLQTIALIDAYENGGLQDLKFQTTDFVDGIEYEIHPDYKSKNLTEEQELFLDLLKEKVGEKGILKPVDMEDVSKGFCGLDDFWSTYWRFLVYILARAFI